MKSQKLLQGSSIVLSVFSVFVVQNTFLSNYSSYLLAFLIIFYAIYISIKKRSKSGSELFTSNPSEIYGIISIILLILVLTGSLSSPLFFFLYFILFLLAFVSESVTVWIFTLAIILFFIPEGARNFTSDTIIKFGSILLISPIAYFVGKEFERRNLLSKRIDAKTDDIIQEAQVLKNTGVSIEENEAIDEIIEEAESLKEDSK